MKKLSVTYGVAGDVDSLEHDCEFVAVTRKLNRPYKIKENVTGNRLGDGASALEFVGFIDKRGTESSDGWYILSWENKGFVIKDG
jgi:hypothetical protein